MFSRRSLMKLFGLASAAGAVTTPATLKAAQTSAGGATASSERWHTGKLMFDQLKINTVSSMPAMTGRRSGIWAGIEAMSSIGMCSVVFLRETKFGGLYFSSHFEVPLKSPAVRSFDLASDWSWLGSDNLRKTNNEVLTYTFAEALLDHQRFLAEIIDGLQINVVAVDPFCHQGLTARLRKKDYPVLHLRMHDIGASARNLQKLNEQRMLYASGTDFTRLQMDHAYDTPSGIPVRIRQGAPTMIGGVLALLLANAARISEVPGA